MKKIKKKDEEFDQIQIIYLLAGIVILVGIILGVWFIYGYFTYENRESTEINLKNQEENQKMCKYQRILDGVCVETNSEINPKLVAVMIENHSEARPQSGLSQASVVYEVPVEANYTRFLVIYPANISINEVGPIRSARPYYLDWLSEYGEAQYMHVGGSPVSLDLIKKYKINDLNEFYHGWYYWRSTKRSAPHNVYTSSEVWNKALENYEDNYKNQEYESWKFDNELKMNKEESITHKNSIANFVEEIKISFLPPIYEAIWKFNTSTNKYERYQMGQPHTDYDNTPIIVDNVIVQKVTSQVLDSIGRLAIDTIGSGEVIIFQNGFFIEGTWKKEERSSRTKFYDSNDEEIKLNPGKIWIEIANERTKVSY